MLNKAMDEEIKFQKKKKNSNMVVGRQAKRDTNYQAEMS